MIPALLVLLVAQAPVSAPPLVAADMSDALLVPPPIPAPAAPATAPPLLRVSEEEPAVGGRLAATFTGALLGAVPAVTTIALGLELCRSDPDCTTLTVLTGILSAPLTTGLGAWLAHRLTGGHGTFWKGVSGAALGWGLSMFGVYGLGLVNQTTSAPAEWALVGCGSAVAFLITTALLEFSHHSEQVPVGVGVMPVDGGGVLSLGARF